MKKIVYETNDGVSILTPSVKYFESLLKVLKNEDGETRDLSELESAVYDMIAYKDIKRLSNGVVIEWDPSEMTIDEYLKLPPPDYKIVDSADIPTDRTFRNAWGYDLKEDIGKSKGIWKDKLRVDRKPLLESLDVDYMRANENGQDTSVIVAEKVRLRDITILVDSCETIEDIKNIKC